MSTLFSWHLWNMTVVGEALEFNLTNRLQIYKCKLDKIYHAALFTHVMSPANGRIMSQGRDQDDHNLAPHTPDTLWKSWYEPKVASIAKTKFEVLLNMLTSCTWLEHVNRGQKKETSKIRSGGNSRGGWVMRNKKLI